MNDENSVNSLRILVADDDEMIRSVFVDTFEAVASEVRKSPQPSTDTTDLSSAGFGNIEVTACSSGEEAVESVRLEVENGNPFAVAFIDITMPPGKGGIWAAKQIRQLDPNINIIIVTGNLDIDANKIVKEISPPDKLLFIEKPFHPQEITQFAYSFGSKYNAEKALQRAYGELEERVEQRTAELKSTNKRLENEIVDREKIEHNLRDAKELAESADSAKSNFLSNMSHEIRTPLNGVIGMADLLKEMVEDQQQSQYIDVIINSSKNLLNVINQILEYSRIESGSVVFDCITFGATACVESTVDLVNMEAHRKGLQLATWVMPNVPRFFKGDPIRFRQVLSNFINNAIKFSNDGQIVVIASLESEADEDVTIRVKISDTGIGVNKEDAEKLFRPFSQLDESSTRSYGGIGLSLAINKRLVTMMGGEIGVDLDNQNGATFWFTAKFKKESDLGKVDSELPNYEGYRALVVERNLAIQDVYTNQLSGFGFVCDRATDDDGALQKFRECGNGSISYDLIIMATNLPADQIANIYKEIAGNADITRIPKIFLTTPNAEENTPADIDLGPNMVVPTPVKEYYLLQAIAALLKEEQD